jgi:hypothetical protein
MGSAHPAHAGFAQGPERAQRRRTEESRGPQAEEAIRHRRPCRQDTIKKEKTQDAGWSCHFGLSFRGGIAPPVSVQRALCHIGISPTTHHPLFATSSVPASHGFRAGFRAQLAFQGKDANGPSWSSAHH